MSTSNTAFAHRVAVASEPADECEEEEEEPASRPASEPADICRSVSACAASASSRIDGARPPSAGGGGLGSGGPWCGGVAMGAAASRPAVRVGGKSRPVRAWAVMAPSR